MDVNDIQKRAYALTANCGLRMDIHVSEGGKNCYGEKTVIVAAFWRWDGEVRNEAARISYPQQLDVVMPQIVEKLKEGTIYE